MSKHRALLAAAMCVWLAAISGCAGAESDPAPTPSASSPAINVPGVSSPSANGTGGPSRGMPDAKVDPTDVDAVAKAVTGALLTVDSREDNTSGDAVRRARPYLTESGYQSLSQSPIEVATIDWDEFVASDAYNKLVRVDVNSDDPAPDTSAEAWRGYIVETQEVGPGGWTGIGVTYNAYVHVIKEDDSDEWKADTVEIRQEMA